MHKDDKSAISAEAGHTFDDLVLQIQSVHDELASQAARAVNVSLTLRNWLIGFYIDEYELQGADRAKYGENLLDELAKALAERNLSNCHRRQLYDYLRFYRTYPQIVPTLSALFETLSIHNVSFQKHHLPSLSALNMQPGEELVNRLSYSMFRLLVDLDDDQKRAFYEHECLRGCWSVRELKRQIGSLYYERTALSTNKEKLTKITQQGAEITEKRLDIRDPYIFEFLGLKPAEAANESYIEDELLNKLQDFLLELGHGFCFEARQKRILIGGEHFFVDLVFYHRLLKCHVLVELKNAPFSHESIGQLNTYVTWYRMNVMVEGDNPPIGLLLCNRKNQALVEYALAGIDNDLFVSKYLLELPKTEDMQRFLDEQLSILDGEIR